MSTADDLRLTSQPGLFGCIDRRGEAAAAIGEDAWLQAMLDVEAALARAAAEEGIIPADAAAAIVAVCRADLFDIPALARVAADHATPVVGLVAALRALVGAEHAEHVHCGATSQDIIDTALMLLAHRALGPLLRDAAAAGAAAARLASAHRDTPMLGRTLLQPALPTTFGLRAAGWLMGLDEARFRLDQIRRDELAVEMGGPVGARGPAVARRVATVLGLTAPVLPWGAIRVRPASLATGLGVLSGVEAKIARDVTLLAQGELGECREGGEGRGGSSAMAHKRNPVAAVSVLACAKRVPGLVAGALAAMEQEHERAAGAWQAEWGIYTELVALTGAATAWTADLLDGLIVDSERMLANLADSPAGDAPVPDGAHGLIEGALAAHAAGSQGVTP